MNNAHSSHGGIEKPILFDFFCCAGGCTKGYQRAGFYVVGIDKNPQPNYCGDEFVQMDALEALRVLLDGGTAAGYRLGDFTVIHASPPCQAFTNAQVIHGREHPDLLTPTRELLKQTGLPWVIENVPGAPMRRDLVLCGSMFGLGSENGGLIRHRWFEFWEPHSPLVAPCQHRDKTISVFGHGGHVYHGVEDWRKVMDIDWMTRDEMTQAIPPAYTEHIGRDLMEEVKLRAQAVAA